MKPQNTIPQLDVFAVGYSDWNLNRLAREVDAGCRRLWEKRGGDPDDVGNWKAWAKKGRRVK